MVLLVCLLIVAIPILVVFCWILCAVFMVFGYIPIIIIFTINDHLRNKIQKEIDKLNEEIKNMEVK